MFQTCASILDYRTRRVPLVELEHESVVAKVASEIIAEAADVDNAVGRIVMSNTPLILRVTALVPTRKGHRNGSTGVGEEGYEVLAHVQGSKLGIERSIVDKSCKPLFKQVLVNQRIMCPTKKARYTLKISTLAPDQVSILPIERERSSSKSDVTIITRTQVGGQKRLFPATATSVTH